MDRQGLKIMPTPVKVLVVDDSVFMRQMIKKMLEADPQIKVVGYARNGQEALEKIQRFKPNVLTLDVEMPGLDGLQTLERLMCCCPTPVVMLSAVTSEGAQATIKALELGAVDFAAKPERKADIVQLAQELPLKVKMAANVPVTKVCPQKKLKPHPVIAQPSLTNKIKKKPIDVVAIGTSTGGPAALHTLINSLPPQLPAALLIVQHMPPGFTASLAKRLNELGRIPVKEAQNGDLVQKGRALLAPAGWQMELEKEGAQVRVKLSKKSPIPTLFKPSVDVLFMSVAQIYGARSLGVILTGMGNDGLRGLRAMKEQGALGLAEDESTCIVYGMPRAVTEAGLVDKIAPLNRLASEIVNFVSK